MGRRGRRRSGARGECGVAAWVDGREGLSDGRIGRRNGAGGRILAGERRCQQPARGSRCRRHRRLTRIRRKRGRSLRRRTRLRRRARLERCARLGRRLRLRGGRCVRQQEHLGRHIGAGDDGDRAPGRQFGRRVQLHLADRRGDAQLARNGTLGDDTADADRARRAHQLRRQVKHLRAQRRRLRTAGGGDEIGERRQRRHDGVDGHGTQRRVAAAA